MNMQLDIVVIVSLLVLFLNNNNCSSLPLLVDSILDETYDGRIPLPSKGNPLKVQLTMELEGVDMLQDDEQEISVFVGIQERWTDGRLNRTREGILANQTTVDELARLWSPDLHFLNAKESSVLKYVLRVAGDGKIVKYSKWSVIVPCQMTFFYFPFDRHQCGFKLTNLEYFEQELSYEWATDVPSLIIDPDISKSSLYSFRGYKQSNFTSTWILGNNSGLELNLFLSRKTHRNFPFFYFPAIALTLISFVSLWIESKIHGVYLSLSSFLTMTIFFVQIQHEVPTFFEMGMLDHYYFVCLNLILNAVIVNTIMYCYLNPSELGQGPQKLSPSNKGNGITSTKVEMKRFDGMSNGDAEDSLPTYEDPEERIHQLSRFKRIVYFKACKPAKYQLPIGFAVINVIYWIWMLIAALQFPTGFQKLPA